MSQLDGAAERVKTVSPLVDDFVSNLYPPLSHTETVQRVRLSLSLEIILSVMCCSADFI